MANRNTHTPEIQSRCLEPVFWEICILPSKKKLGRKNLTHIINQERKLIITNQIRRCQNFLVRLFVFFGRTCRMYARHSSELAAFAGAGVW